MAAPRVDRRLAAIMAVDVVGYRRLIGIDEAGTLARVKVHRVELAESLIAEHDGRFEAAQGKGMGVLRLTEDPGNRLKAWTLLTALEELNPSHRDERCSPLATRQGVEGRP
jgi:class 3 adenylate cyclase